MVIEQTLPEPAMIVYASRVRLLLCAVIEAGVLALGVLEIASAGHDTGDGTSALAGGFLAVVGAACLLIALRLRRRPLVRVTADGLDLHVSLWRREFVAWRSVAQLSVRDSPAHLVVDFADPVEASASLTRPTSGERLMVPASLIAAPKALVPRILAYRPPPTTI